MKKCATCPAFDAAGSYSGNGLCRYNPAPFATVSPADWCWQGQALQAEPAIIEPPAPPRARQVAFADAGVGISPRKTARTA